jgi:hypothetical protein
MRWLGNPISELGQMTPFGAARSGAFSPADLPGLQLWLAADKLTGLINGDALGVWPDVSGNGRDATQITLSQKPTYRTNGLNGLPVVRFDGVDDVLNCPTAVYGLTGLTIVMVINYRADFAGYAWHSPSKWTGTADASMSMYRFGQAAGGSDRTVVLLANAGGTWQGVCPGYVTAINTWHFVQHTYDAVTGGLLQINRNTPVVAPGSLGNLAQNSQPLSLTDGDSIDLAEMLIFNRSLSTGERLSISNYLSRWGL